MNFKKIKIFVLAFIAILVTLSAASFYFFPVKGDIPVLMYHFVGSHEDALFSKNFVSVEGFKKQMAYLKFFGFKVISIQDYEKIMLGHQKPEGREVLLTFDDGNYSFENHALPVLEELNYPVTVFAVSESLQKTLHGSMSLDAYQRILISGLVTIASHTKSHPFLTETNETQLKDEIFDSKKDLQALFNRPIAYIAYPYGHCNQRVLEVTQAAGYKLGFTTSPKRLTGIDEGPFSITRLKMTRSSDNPFVFWIKLSGAYQAFKGFRHSLK